MEVSTAHRNSKAAPKIGKYAQRQELWQVKDLPDSNYYNHLTQFNCEKNELLKLGAIQFHKRADRRGHYDPKEA